MEIFPLWFNASRPHQVIQQNMESLRLDFGNTLVSIWWKTSQDDGLEDA